MLSTVTSDSLNDQVVIKQGTNRKLRFYQADSRHECNLSSPFDLSPLSQHVWFNEIHTNWHVYNIRHIVSHFPFILSKLTCLQPSVSLGTSTSLSVYASIDVTVSIATIQHSLFTIYRVKRSYCDASLVHILSSSALICGVAPKSFIV